VFVPYEYGDRLDVDPFNAADKEYLSGALEALTARYIATGNVDLVAELLSCSRFLRLVESPVYRKGLAFLLDNQHEDGSWGDRSRARRAFGAQADAGMMLHTTLVVIDALSVAFHRPWMRELYPDCDHGSAGASRQPHGSFTAPTLRIARDDATALPTRLVVGAAGRHAQ
jgi:hypothetical protein